MTVAENIAFPLKLRGVDAQESAQRVAEALATVQLDNLGERDIDQLSGGQRQRVALARAFVFRPRILLMDEPCSALDPKGTAAVEELIWELRGKYSILIVTHNMAQARRASEECIFMLMGKVVEHTDTAESLRQLWWTIGVTVVGLAVLAFFYF